MRRLVVNLLKAGIIQFIVFYPLSAALFMIMVWGLCGCTQVKHHLVNTTCSITDYESRGLTHKSAVNQIQIDMSNGLTQSQVQAVVLGCKGGNVDIITNIAETVLIDIR